MLQNNLFSKKRDAINITPFLDIMLVLFVVIIVVSSFKENFLSKKKEELLFKKINMLQKQVSFLKEENTKLLKKNNFLREQVSQKNFLLKQTQEVLNKCTLEVKVLDNYLKIGNTRYSLAEFLNLAENGFVKNANFYIKKTKNAENFYEVLKNKLKKIGFKFTNSE